MHKYLLSVLVATLPAMPLMAQSSPVEMRVDRLEKELKAVQRKVFPGGAGSFIEPEISAPAATQSPAPGSPSGTPVSDLTVRVNALESQLASLTGQIEQNGYKLRQLEESFAKYKAETDAKLSPGDLLTSDQTVTTPAPAAITPRPVVSTPATPANPTPKPVVATTSPKPAVAKPAAPTTAASEARKLAVAAVERPDTGNASEDAYTYGFRLWSAKFYPEAQVQLEDAVKKFPKAATASKARNLLGRAYVDDGKPSSAAKIFYANYQADPKGDRAAESLARLGDVLVQIKKPAEACKVYRELDDVYGPTLSASLTAMMAKGRASAKCAA